MYILAHLLAGILLGVLLAYLFRDSLLILACGIGSILPDLVDKPVGILLLADTLGYGRIYCHTLLFTGLVLGAGILVYTRYRRAGLFVIAMGVGILSHQVLDAMWLEPRNWYWPALGSFKGRSEDDFFLDYLQRALHNPTEWLAGAIILAILAIYSIPRYRERFLSDLHGPWLKRPSLPLLLLIMATAALVLAIGIYYG
jgi:hypothetical protein